MQKLTTFRNFKISNWIVGCRIKANCLLVGPGPIGGEPSVGVILKFQIEGYNLLHISGKVLSR